MKGIPSVIRIEGYKTYICFPKGCTCAYFPEDKTTGYKISHAYFPEVKTTGYKISHVCFPEVKTTGYKIIHAYGIGLIELGSSGGTTDVVAMEFIPLCVKAINMFHWLIAMILSIKCWGSLKEFVLLVRNNGLRISLP